MNLIWIIPAEGSGNVSPGNSKETCKTRQAAILHNTARIAAFCAVKLE
jgi:hypothetical protein